MTLFQSYEISILKNLFFLIFDTNLGYHSVRVDLFSTFMKCNGTRSINCGLKIGLKTLSMRFSAFYPHTFYTLLEGYFCGT